MSHLGPLSPGVRAGAGDGDGAPSLINYSAPATLAYHELIEVYKSATPSATIRPKLEALLTEPFISNEAYAAGPDLSPLRSNKIGPFIRAGFWNIERGLRIGDIERLIKEPEMFKEAIRAEKGSERYNDILEEMEVLRSVDILVLNEADLGLKRTGYRDVTRELAASLNMNYAFGVEFIEIDPVNLGTEEFKKISSEQKRSKLRQAIEVDAGRYIGLHGTAILSRFPIKQARLIPLKTQAYDWYKKERDRVSIAESARRQLGKMWFQQEVGREIRYGGRCVLIAELDVPHLPEGSLTVVATHLEDRTNPSERRKQMQEVLSIIKSISGLVILAGDLNTAGMNNSPTSIRIEIMRRVRSKEFWTKRVIKSLASLGPVFDFLLEALAFSRTLQDPTARGVFLVGPNKEADLFKDLERMRFDDGYAFDFRGDAARTVNETKGTLANSNQRSTTKGFIPTRASERNYWSIGKNKLDWIFVKAFAREPRGKDEPYRMAPHFPRTLEKLNEALSQRLSDHSPLTVDLPLEEPRP